MPTTPHQYGDKPGLERTQRSNDDSALREVAKMWSFARETGLSTELKALHRPRPLLSLLATLLDWLIIALATVSVLDFGWIAFPLAIIVIGNRQRALGNLLHDASHYSFDANRKRAVALANLLLCWPLWQSMSLYRTDHNHHHWYVGDPVLDPDYIQDETRLPLGWKSVWWDQVRSAKSYRTALLGHLGTMDFTSHLAVTGWWLTVLGLIAAGFGAESAGVFLGLWVTARATTFHLITTFREISDHVGLQPGSVIGFSRNHPFASMAGHLFHPHHNGYHLLHHLTPGVPFHALPRAHQLLLNWPPYVAGEHCDSYFLGASPAVDSWVKRWAPSR